MGTGRRSAGFVRLLVVVLAILVTWFVLEPTRTKRGQAPETPAALAPAAREDSRPELTPSSAAATGNGSQRDGTDPPGPSSVVVEVVDEEGEPVGGVELELVAWTDRAEESLARASSGADGRAQLLPERSPAAGARFRVVCRAAFWPAPVLELGTELPGRPVTLRLPLHGVLEVQLLRDGQPIEHAARVELRPVEAPEQAPCSLVVRGGLARFEAVGLGLELELAASCEESGPAEPVHVVGPRRAGERVSVVLSLGPIWPRVRLQVLDAEGRPMADECFEGWVDYGNRAAPLSDAPRSDRQGWLEFRLPGDAPAQGGRTLVLRLAQGSDGRRARLTVPDPLASSGVEDLGPLHWPAEDG